MYHDPFVAQPADLFGVLGVVGRKADAAIGSHHAMPWQGRLVRRQPQSSNGQAGTARNPGARGQAPIADDPSRRDLAQRREDVLVALCAGVVGWVHGWAVINPDPGRTMTIDLPRRLGMEHVELVVKFLLLGGFITSMMWLDRRFDLGMNDWGCGMRRSTTDDQALRARLEALEAVVTDRDYELDREFDVLRRRAG